jgi:hypothetical protein
MIYKQMINLSTVVSSATNGTSASQVIDPESAISWTKCVHTNISSAVHMELPTQVNDNDMIIQADIVNGQSIGVLVLGMSLFQCIST